MWTNYFGKIILVSLVRPGNDRTAIAEQQLKKFKGDSPEFAFIKLTEAIEWYNTYTQNNQP